MSFNPVSTKPAEEMIFSCKKKSTLFIHHFFLQNAQVERVNYHKHLGLILDPKPSFVRHINEKIHKAKKLIEDIGLTAKKKTIG